MRERHAKNMIIRRAAGSRDVGRSKKSRHLPRQFRNSQKVVRGRVGSVGGLLRRMAGVIT
jgi:hypothetical protein